MSKNVKYLNSDSVRVYNTPSADPNTASVYDRTRNPLGSQQSSVLAPTAANTPQVTPFAQPQANQSQVYLQTLPVIQTPELQRSIEAYATLPAAKQNTNKANAHKVRDDSSSSARVTSYGGKRVVDIARQYTKSSNPYHNAYVYGAWDCSKFAQTVASKAGVTIPRDSASQIQYFKNKRALFGLKQARAGDIIFMRSGASASGRHVGIYIGNGQMIDNSGSGRPIKVHSIAGRSVIGFGRMNVKIPKAKQRKADRTGRVAGTQFTI